MRVGVAVSVKGGRLSVQSEGKVESRKKRNLGWCLDSVTAREGKRPHIWVWRTVAVMDTRPHKGEWAFMWLWITVTPVLFHSALHNGNDGECIERDVGNLGCIRILSRDKPFLSMLRIFPKLLSYIESLTWETLRSNKNPFLRSEGVEAGRRETNVRPGFSPSPAICITS